MLFEHLEEECKIQLIPRSIGKDWVDGFTLSYFAGGVPLPLVNGWAAPEGVCFIFGDVYYSEEAIKTIVESETDDIEFFASSPPFSKYYVKEWAEPFGFKVKNAKKFLADGNKVKITVRFRGRELNYAKAGEELLNKFAEELSDIANLDKKASLEGKNMFIILSSK
mgnify:CR=1 FL=1